MFDHSVEQVEEIVIQGDDQDQNSQVKQTNTVHNDNEIILNEDNKGLLPDLDQLDENPLEMDDLDCDDKNEDPLGLFS